LGVQEDLPNLTESFGVHLQGLSSDRDDPKNESHFSPPCDRSNASCRSIRSDRRSSDLYFPAEARDFYTTDGMGSTHAAVGKPHVCRDFVRRSDPSLCKQ
jgi:hypothetical protein